MIERPLIVLPTYNEAGNIVELLTQVATALSSANLLVVDDNSPDGTAELAEKAGIAIGDDRVTVLPRREKLGLGSAYQAGFRWGLDRGHDALFQMDSDFQHDPSALPALLAALDGGADVAVGSRYVPGGTLPPNWGWHRRALSRWANRYARLMLRVDVRDATAGFRGLRSSFVERLDLDAIRADGYGFQVELTYQSARAGGRVVEVPIHFGERGVGDSKMSMRIILEAMLVVTRWGFRDRLKR